MTDKFLPVPTIKIDSFDVINRQRRQLQFWRTWAVMMTFFFLILFVYVVADH